MAVTIFIPYTTTNFEKRNYLDHHCNPSGTINKAKWLLSKSERNHNKLNDLAASIDLGPVYSLMKKSWLAAFYMAEYCIFNNIKNIEDEFNINKYKDYTPRKSTSSKNIPWYDCLLKPIYENIKKTNSEQLAKRVCELQSDLSREKSKNEKLIEDLKNEKQLNAEIKKRLVEVEYDCEEFNHEYCDVNCKGKRKETVDLYQLVSDGLYEAQLKQKDEEIKRLEKENEQLKQQIKKIGDFIQAGDLCSICKFENKCNPNECYSQNIRVYTKWELEE